MDSYLRNLIVKKWKIKNFSFTFLDILLAVCITGTGVMLRLAVIDYTVTDLAKKAAMLAELPLIIWCMMIVFDYTGSRLRAFLTYAILAIYPTVVANGALWGKGSVCCTWFFILGLYMYEREDMHRRFRAGLGIICTGAGAVIALSQIRLSTRSLTLGWPNLYEIIGKEMFVELYNQVSLLVLAGLLLTGIYVFVKKGVKLTRTLALQLFLFLAILIPYLAPSMPAWAGYTADIGAFLYAMYRPEKFYLPMLHLIVSYSAYANEINGTSKLPMVLYAVILLVLLADVGRDIYRETAK